MIKTFKIEKLIRDNMPKLLRARGVVVHTQTIDKSEYIQCLKNKLIEESLEVCQAQNAGDITEELGDLLEVIRAFATANNITLEDIEKVRLLKRSQKGGFEGMSYNVSIEIDSDSEFMKYYTKYEEVK